MKGLKHFDFFTITAQLHNNFLVNNFLKEQYCFNSNFYLPSKKLTIKESKNSSFTIFFNFWIFCLYLKYYFLKCNPKLGSAL